MDIFERASRAKLRFNSEAGLLSTEQLWELPLVARTGKVSLDMIARGANRELKELGEESFVETKANPAKSAAELRMEIIRYVISSKQADAERAAKAAETSVLKDKLVQALANKQEASLQQLSEEEIKKKLAELA